MYLNFNTKQLTYIFLLVLLMCIIAIRGSINLKFNETFIDNAFTIQQPLPEALALAKRTNGISTGNEAQLTEEEKARIARMNKWKDCNIFTCKNPDSEGDYEAWLKAQKDKLTKYLDNDKKKMSKSSLNKKESRCPSRISQDEWNEDILTEDEKDAEARLEDLQNQEDELNQRLRDLQAQHAEQQREFTMNAAMQQQAMNDLESAQNSQKDMKFFENAIDMHVKPWQEEIKQVDKKVTSYEKPIKSISDILIKIDELKEKVESIQSISSAAPAAVATKKKKKKKGLQLKKSKKKKTNNTNDNDPPSNDNNPSSSDTKKNKNKKKK
jgi:chromosome segregation ATPase